MPGRDALLAPSQQPPARRQPPRRQPRRAQQHPPQRGRSDPRAWRASIALFACFCAATAAMHSLLQDSGWWFAIAGVVLAVLGSAAAVRGVSARPWRETLIASLVLAGVITLVFAQGTAFLFVVPTPATVGVMAALGQEGAASIAGQSVPAEATAGVVFLLCLGTGVLAVLADQIAITWRRPALAAVPLAAIVGIPTVVGAQLADVFFIVLTGACWLVLLRTGDPFPQTARALGVGALAVVVTLLGPLLVPHVDGAGARGDRFSGYLASVNPVLELGDELRRDVPRTILNYSPKSGDPSYLRLVSLRNFLPDTWAPDPPAIDLENVPAEVGVPSGLADDVAVTEEITSVGVGNLGSQWLPVPYPATRVDGLRGDWYWNADDLSFSSPHHVAQGEEYVVTSLEVQPTPAQLEAASSMAETDGPSGVDGMYLELPADLPAIIGDTAREVTASAASDYARAVALQEYFRNGAFAYSETAPVDNDYDSNGMVAIARFLEAKSGYCIHFASAMAIMARTLDIPSRVTVGFLPGEKLKEGEDTEAKRGDTTFRVTTRDVHTWPELYFEGIGWTRFEPTPGLGFVPSYADEATPGVPIAPRTGQTPAATPTPTAPPTRPEEQLDELGAQSGSAASASLLGWFTVALVGLGLALVLLIPAGVRVAQRVIRLRRGDRGHPAATTLWRELLQSANDLGIDIDDTSTPREAASAISRAARLGDPDQVTLTSIRELVERQSFAGESPKLQGAGADRKGEEGAVLAARTRRILDRMRSATERPARWRAAIAPRSIWSRILDGGK